MKKIYIVFLAIVAIFLLYFINSVIGNPVNKALATSYAKQFVATQFEDDHYKLEVVGFNFDTKMYDYIVQRTGDDSQWSYSLTINSKIANRSVDSFQLHESVLNEALSKRLSSEGQVHVANIVHQVLPKATVEYEVYVPSGVYDDDIVWAPGFNLDLNAIIYINQTVSTWDDAAAEKIDQQLIKAFNENGIYYSRVSIRVTEENMKDGITYMKTIYKKELYQNEEL